MSMRRVVWEPKARHAVQNTFYFLRVESSPDQSAQGRNRSTETEKVKKKKKAADSSIRMPSCKVQTKVRQQRGETNHPRSWSLRHRFICPGEVRSKHRLLNIDLAKTSSRVPRGGWQVPCGMSMRYARRESDRRLSQAGAAKPRVAASLRWPYTPVCNRMH